MGAHRRDNVRFHRLGAFVFFIPVLYAEVQFSLIPPFFSHVFTIAIPEREIRPKHVAKTQLAPDRRLTVFGVSHIP